jgi:hypothetical protein
MLLLHLDLLSIVCPEMLTFHKSSSLVFNLLFTILGGEVHVDISQGCVFSFKPFVYNFVGRSSCGHLTRVRL